MKFRLLNLISGLWLLTGGEIWLLLIFRCTHNVVRLDLHQPNPPLFIHGSPAYLPADHSATPQSVPAKIYSTFMSTPIVLKITHFTLTWLNISQNWLDSSVVCGLKYWPRWQLNSTPCLFKNRCRVLETNGFLAWMKSSWLMLRRGSETTTVWPGGDAAVTLDCRCF